MTHAELCRKMSTAEFAQWIGFYMWEAKELEREARRARGASGRRR